MDLLPIVGNALVEEFLDSDIIHSTIPDLLHSVLGFHTCLLGKDRSPNLAMQIWYLKHRTEESVAVFIQMMRDPEYATMTVPAMLVTAGQQSLHRPFSPAPVQ